MVEPAVAAIRAGEPVILPTDTVYGLCAAPDRAGLLSLLKGRPSWMPVALVCADVARLLVLETHECQAQDVAATLESLGYTDVTVTPDLAGKPRVVEGRK